MNELNPKKRNPLLVGFIALGVLGIVFVALLSLVIFLIGGEKESYFQGRERIALVPIEGVISDSEEIVRQIKKYGEDSRIKGIILRINTPGGGVAPAQEIFNEVERMQREHKKVFVTSMGSLAASGGYYVACATDKIVANPGTITGSIGVIMTFANLEKLMKKVGIETDILKSGRHKDMGLPTRPLTAEDKLVLQAVIDDVYEQFIEVVSRKRNITLVKVRGFADGRIFSGRQAKKMGLVDELGNLQDAILYLSKLVGIKGEPVVVQEKKRKNIFLRLLGEKLSYLFFRGEEIAFKNMGLQYLWSYN